ncbi:uncharacterized protein LOC128988425 isoform X2 [Macrosteles quadrilineatus]|uniref:uncharacterized protein LOC128988425 isoform X2 n=1 Tax=Macrosteles quadrilineatus TaxID=74068 RepID=UPI0023E10556|nr:uncharacterized protein LOC128988425 isoform X2 [Macrosteles quadrilineatus]
MVRFLSFGCKPTKCFKPSIILENYLNEYVEAICCLCTNYRFGSYFYTMCLAIFGMVLTLADICRTVTNGPLAICKSRKVYPNNDWFLCPRLERDLNLMGSFFNLLMYIFLLIGLLSFFLFTYLVYKLIILTGVLLVYLIHVIKMNNIATKWNLIVLAFSVHNMVQVACILISFT